MIKYLLLAVEKFRGVTKLSADLIKTSKKVREGFLLFFFPVLVIAFSLAECKTPEERAQEFALTKEQACPNFGKLNREKIEKAIFIHDGRYENLQLHDMVVGISDAMEARAIKTKKDYTRFTKLYKKICGEGDVPFKEEIEYYDKVVKEEYNDLESMAKAAKINLDQILDLRNESVREEFLLAWYNSKENPDIKNSIYYPPNEFKFKEDKKKFEDYRKYKYAITDTYWVWGDYDFKKNAFEISQTNRDFFNQIKYIAPEYAWISLKKPLKDSDTIKSNTWFSISSDKAEKFKNHEYDRENVVILTKFSPAYYSSPGKCGYAVDMSDPLQQAEYKQCKAKYETSQLKIKYLSLETLKYRIVYDGEVYKNF